MANSRIPVKYIPPAPSTVARFNARLVELQQIRKYAAFLPAQSMTTEEYVRKYILRDTTDHNAPLTKQAPISMQTSVPPTNPIPPSQGSTFSLFAYPLPQPRQRDVSAEIKNKEQIAIGVLTSRFTTPRT